MSVKKLTQTIETVRYGPGVVSSFVNLQTKLQNHGWLVQSWTDSPGTVHSPHDHPYSHRVLCRSGWIEFTVNGETYRLERGDILDLPARVTHEATSHPDQSTKYWLLRPEK